MNHCKPHYIGDYRIRQWKNMAIQSEKKPLNEEDDISTRPDTFFWFLE